MNIIFLFLSFIQIVFHPFDLLFFVVMSISFTLLLSSLQRFTADFRDLTSWVTEMKALINADELANDVAGAEALLDRHQEHRVRCASLARS